MIMKSRIFFVVLAVLIFSTPLFSREKMRIAVLDLKADGVSARTARTVSSMIRTELVNIGKFVVIERAQMNAIVKEQGLQKTGCTDQECAVKLGKLMSARKILIGEVSPLGSSLIMNVRIVDVERGVSEFAAKEKSATEDMLDRAVSKMSRKLAARIGGSPVETVAEDIPGVTTPSGYYMRGIIPGWGQIYAGSRIKGYAYLGTFVVLGAGFIYAYSSYSSEKKDYDDMEAGLPKSEYDSQYDKYEQSANIAVVTLGLFLGFYIFNWVDLMYLTKPEYGKSISSVDSGNKSMISFNAYNYSTRYLAERRMELRANLRF
jgi:TolB-like protein